MKQPLLIIAALVALSVYCISCGKGTESNNSICTNTPVDNDSTALINFATANNITTTKDASGLYYQIMSAGSGTTSPNGNSMVKVKYKGTLLNGTVFDSTKTDSTASFYLYQLITGWQIGVPKIKAGGRIKLLMPSALAYGCQGVKTPSGVVLIPENAPIYFDITLVGFQ